MSMRFFVKACLIGQAAETYVIPCKDASWTVGDLKREVLRKKVDSGKGDEKSYKLYFAGSGAVLGEDDLIGDVLRDGDHLSLCPIGTLPAQVMEPPLPFYGVSVCQALSNVKTAEWLELDGNSLSIEDLMKISKGQYRVKLSDAAIEAIKRSRKVVDDIVAAGKVVYGITTGFGKFAEVTVPMDKLIELQESIIRSHSSGVGTPLSPERTRTLLALRINVLAKGFSGITLETLQRLVDALNASCLSYVPDKGTVGASGDLAPLSHLALGLMGEGKMWSPETGWADASSVLESHGLKPIQPKPKEGLSLMNGTQFMTGLGAEALHRAALIAKQADVIAALSIEALKGTPRAFDIDIHRNRPHPGQQVVAARMRALLPPSEIRADSKQVQDAYSMRCVSQVHGVVNDTINFVKGILTTEMNSALDNPLVFADRQEIISGGNFHGEYPAKALDYLAIGIHELANISERRLERLVHPSYSNEMPAFLIKEGGVNSGFMIPQYTSAALVSENKVLTHPSSVDSITTCAGTEDHVSMGGFAARKALRVVEHVEQVLAIELLAACQGIEFRRPKKASAPLEEVYSLVRACVRPLDKDRFMTPDIETVTKLVQEGKVWEVVKPYINKYEAESTS